MRELSDFERFPDSSRKAPEDPGIPQKFTENRVFAKKERSMRVVFADFCAQ